MWRTVNGDEIARQVEASHNLMAAPQAFKTAMQMAVDKWPYSTEHNLTAAVINRRAWLGHAGCFLAVGSVEACTRRAWNTLSEEQQVEADRVAQEVIDEWTIAQIERMEMAIAETAA